MQSLISLALTAGSQCINKHSALYIKFLLFPLDLQNHCEINQTDFDDDDEEFQRETIYVIRKIPFKILFFLSINSFLA